MCYVNILLELLKLEFFWSWNLIELILSLPGIDERKLRYTHIDFFMSNE